MAWPKGRSAKNLKDLTGLRFGRLTVKGRADSPETGQAKWVAVCDCGGETVSYGNNLRRGNTASCGCLQVDRTIAASTTHNMSYTSEYRIWNTMRTRCFNVKSRKYKDYGGRGITVCDRWLVFENFYADMGNRPGPAYSIDRINNDGNYESGNCRWATAKQQANNRRSI